MQPKVSVVVPTYNCAKYLHETIHSILTQTLGDFEIIIVDDGSTDDTEKLVQNYLHASGDKIKYIKQENSGPACARNTGIRESSGEFISFLDADDLWLPNKLSAQIGAFDKNPHVGLVHTDSFRFGGSKGIYCNRSWMSAEQIERQSGNIFLDYYFRRCRIMPTTVMIKRECIDKVCYFDEKLSKLGSEDREFFLRILWYYRALYIDEPLAKYRIRSDSVSQNFDRIIKAQCYLYDKITKLYDLPKSYKRKALSSVYSEWANSFFNSSRIGYGVMMQLKSILFNPLNPYPYLLTKKILKNVILRRKC